MDISEQALWRYSVIAPLIHRPEGEWLAGAARRVAREVKTGPDGEPVMVSETTVLRWYRAYQLGGVAALERRQRRDAGEHRALSEKEASRLLDLSAEHPGWTVVAIRQAIERELGKRLSEKAVYRLLKGHRKRIQTDGFPKRELGAPQSLWVADTWHGPPVYGPRRKKSRTYLIAIMDDASRAIMAGRFGLRDDVMSLIPVLRAAVLSRGIPTRLLTDNGANYRARVVRTACATLGIHLIHARPYRPTAKARLERFWLSVKLRMLPRLEPFPTLASLNKTWVRFLAEYHATPHAGLSEQVGQPIAPLAYYLKHLPEGVRYVSDVSLDELLVVEETRKVRLDGTFRLAGKLWEASCERAGERILIRFNPCRPDKATYRPLVDKNAPWQSAYRIL
jgi:transposase